MELANKNVLVIGSGISGIGAACLLEKKGANPILFDSNAKLTIRDILGRFPGVTKTKIYVGALPEDVKKSLDLVVISPGVPIDSPMVLDLESCGLAIWGEIELAYVCGKGDVLAITGTNGKTTTTALTGEIMKDYFDSVFVVGNIGSPYTQAADKTTDSTVTVAEISSFQLETIHEFHPKVSAILNITPDHLNRHHTMECYTETKEKIALNQTEQDTVVLNYDDPLTRDFGTRTNAKVLYFSRLEKLEEGICLDEEETIVYKNGGEVIKFLKLEETNLLGGHNLENIMAACGIAISYGVPVSSICKTVREFKAVEHRIEFVKEVKGVTYYNDSKGTNVDAAIKGIQAMNRRTILIGGGYDKQSEYDEWIEAFDGKVKYLVLIGQTAKKIAACAKRHGFEDVIFADTLEEAVNICHEKSVPGEAVLLSPACASWGMFDNYEQRGRLFKEYVNQL